MRMVRGVDEPYQIDDRCSKEPELRPNRSTSYSLLQPFVIRSQAWLFLDIDII